MLSGIQGYIRHNCIKYKAKHIKGRQDDVKQVDELDRFTVLNVEADFYAKQYWIKRYGDIEKLPLYQNYSIPKSMWEVSLLDNRICKELHSFLRKNIQMNDAVDYWVTKKKGLHTQVF